MKRQPIIDLLFTAGILSVMLFLSTPFVKVILAALISIIYAITNKDRFKSIGFNKPGSWMLALLQSLLLACVIVALTFFIITPLVEYLTDNSIDASLFKPLQGNLDLFLNYLAIGWIVGGISEEIIFRGFLLNRITTYIPNETGVVYAIVITSTLFGFMHGYQGIAGQLQTGIIGALLATIYYVSGKRLTIAILTHGLVNTISFSLIYFKAVEI
ncbi:lysostaphin resistance A-like protein [Ekhidna sp.]